MVPQIKETILAYNQAARTLTYAVTGLPAFITEARVHWALTAVDDRRARIHIDAHLELRGVRGLLLHVPLRLSLNREWKSTLADLKHYVEKGQTSPRKQRRLGTYER